jgi:hypothetical protein
MRFAALRYFVIPQRAFTISKSNGRKMTLLPMDTAELACHWRGEYSMMRSYVNGLEINVRFLRSSIVLTLYLCCHK